MSYVAERQGGGQQDLLRRFESSRNYTTFREWPGAGGSRLIPDGETGPFERRIGPSERRNFYSNNG